MPAGRISNGTGVGAAQSMKKMKQPVTKLRGKDGKDFAFFIPFFLTAKKSGKKERPGEKR